MNGGNVYWDCANPLTYYKFLNQELEIIVQLDKIDDGIVDGYESDDLLKIYYDSTPIKTINLQSECEYGESVIFDLSSEVQWSGGYHQLTVRLCNSVDSVNGDTVDVEEKMPSLPQSIKYVGGKLRNAIIFGGVSASVDDGFASMLEKMKEIKTVYHPLLNGSDSTTTLVSGYDFTTANGYGGAYHQCGYVNDGFRNTHDWELTMNLTTSQWDGGFCLFLTPYQDTDCNEANWNCIYKNGQQDVLQWLDGQIKVNTGSSLQNTGMMYTRNATIPVKIVKKGNVIRYYETDILKGSYVWNKLSIAPKGYVGTMTWGGNSSVNRFSDVYVKLIKNLDPYITSVGDYTHLVGSDSLSKVSDTEISASASSITILSEEFTKADKYILCFEWKLSEGYNGGFLIGNDDEYWCFFKSSNQAVVYHGIGGNASQGGRYITTSSTSNYSSYVPVKIERWGERWSVSINNGDLLLHFDADFSNKFGLAKSSGGTVSVRDMYVTHNVMHPTEIGCAYDTEAEHIWFSVKLKDSITSEILEDKQLKVYVNGTLIDVVTLVGQESNAIGDYEYSVGDDFSLVFEGDNLYDGCDFVINDLN